MVEDSLRESISKSFDYYFNKSVDDIAVIFNLDSKSKGFLEMIVGRILGCQGKVNNSQLFIQSNLTLKTVKIQENGLVKESMSFPAFEFKKIIKTNWKNADIRKMFLKRTFLFVVFTVRNSITYLSHIKFWDMPASIINSDVKKVWKKTVSVIKAGNIVSEICSQKDGKPILKTNFPGASFNEVCHVRPHAQKSIDAYDLPVPDKLTGMTRFTKQCFWLNNTYIRKIVS